MREALGHAERLGDRERAVRAPHRQPAGVARALGDELRRDRAAELAVQAGERRVERRADVVDVAHEERAHAGARGSARARPRAAARRRGRRGRARAARPRRSPSRNSEPSSASRSDTSCGARWTPVPPTASASASCVAKLVISVTSTPSRVRSASLRSRKLSSRPSSTERQRLDLRAEAGRHAAGEHDRGDLAALDGGRAPERGEALPLRRARASGQRRCATSAAGTSIGSVMRCSDSASGSAATKRARRSSNGTRSKWKRASSVGDLRRERRAGDLHQGAP